MIVALALVYQEVGVSMFVGVAYCVCVLPLSMFLFNMIGSIFRERMMTSDKRLKATNEIFSGIRVLKFNAWEVPFQRVVEEFRDKEQQLARKTARILATSFFLQQSIPSVMPLIIFSAYITLGNQLEAVTAFVTIQLLQLLQAPLMMLSSVGTTLTLAQASGTRVMSFLVRPDLVQYVNRDNLLDANSPDVVVRMTSASLGWELPEPKSASAEEKVAEVETIKDSKNVVDAIALAKAGSGSGSDGSVEDENAVTTVEGAGYTPLSTEDSEGTFPIKAASPGASEDVTVAVALPVSTMNGENAHSYNDNFIAPPASPLSSDSLGSSSPLTTSAPLAIGTAEATTATGLDRGVHTLIDVSCEIKRGMVVGIVGPIGCGKSSLLCALLNELHLHSGSVSIQGSVAYHQQNPWIFNASLQNNILFGKPMDDERFAAVIKAAALEPDIASLPSGLSTEIGEKGINLSGGQKARVSFARCMYSDADTYLLDDPLSAVDAHVGHTLFFEGMKTFLRGKTVLLVTHQVQFLSDCDHVIVMDSGRIKAAGSYAALSSSGIDIDSFVKQVNQSSGGKKAAAAGGESSKKGRGGGRGGAGDGRGSGMGGRGGGRGGGGGGDWAGTSGRGGRGRGFNEVATDSGKAAGVEKPSTGATKSSAVIGATRTADNDKDKSSGKKLMTTEAKAKGSVRLRVYWYYISRGHPFIYVLMLLVVLGSQGMSTYAAVWLSMWGTASYHGISEARSFYYLHIYAIFVMLGTFATFINMNLNLEHRTKAAKRIHEDLFKRVVSAPVAFFDTTPLGRIMNVRNGRTEAVLVG